MANAIIHLENAIYHFNRVRRILSAHNDVFRFIEKKSVNVLDVGCGSGRVLLEELLPFLPKNYSSLVGVDKHMSMVEHCRSLKVDPRISFDQLDISTKNMPRKYIGKFDLITSFYCLHYVKDYEQMLQNINLMLKPRGQLLFLQVYKVNPVYDTYRELCKIDCWKPYLMEYENYIAHFSGDNPQDELQGVLEKSGLKCVRYIFEYTDIDLIPKNFIETLKALDTVKDLLPENQREKYNRDFHECFSKVVNLDFVTEEGLNKITKMPYYQLSVHAEKST